MTGDLAKSNWGITKYLSVLGGNGSYKVTLDKDINPLAIDHCACTNDQELESGISLLQESYGTFGEVTTTV